MAGLRWIRKGVGFNVELGENRGHLGVGRKYLCQINVCPREVKRQQAERKEECRGEPEGGHRTQLPGTQATAPMSGKSSCLLLGLEEYITYIGSIFVSVISAPGHRLLISLHMGLPHLPALQSGSL